MCPSGAHKLVDGNHLMDRDRCRACGVCVRTCNAGALEMVGRLATVDEVMEVVLKDVAFYQSSGGGMTVSGGEPLAQPEFTLALLKEAISRGIHCCIETSGYGDWQVIESLLPYTDLFLYDIKETDPRKHKQFTGVEFDPILVNLRKLYAANAEVRLRLPLIPGLNARPDHFEAVGHLIKVMPRLQGVEIIPYHRLGEGKRERLGHDCLEYNTNVPDEDVVAWWVAQLNEFGVDVLPR